jgi:hypothetical protein
MKRHLWTAGIAVMGTLWLMFFAALDDFGGDTPWVAVAVFWLYTGAMLFAMAKLAGRKPFRLMAVYSVALLAVWVVPWNAQKQFIRDLHRIPDGASVFEARAAMERWCKRGGWRNVGFTDAAHNPVSGPRLASDGYLIIPTVCAFRGSSRYDGGNNNGYGEVRFSGGRVAGVRYETDD